VARDHRRCLIHGGRYAGPLVESSAEPHHGRMMSEQRPEPDAPHDSDPEDDVPDAPSDPSDPPAEPGEPLNPA
jgi:hypothetical protein